MAVIVADSNNASYDGNISKANGFYRAESYNLTAMHTVVYFTPTTAYNLPVTFANAGNCQGIIVAISVDGNATGQKSIQVTLQEQTAPGVWTDRTSVTVAPTTIGVTNNNNSPRYPIYPFVFSTPYAIDTTASKWRFSFISTGAGTGGYYNLITSNGSSPFYITWCDTQVSYSANDTLVCKDNVTIDQSCTFQGIAGTGAPNDCTAIVICRGADNTKANMARLVWQNPPSSSYTLTIKGEVLMGAYSGWNIGSSSNPISTANRAVICWDTPPSGGISATGIRYVSYSYHYCDKSGNLLWYGAYPSYPKTTLAADANIGETTITTTDTTGWSIGDVIIIGKRNYVTGPITKTIQNIVGTTVTLNSAISGYKHYVGGTVANMNSALYGIYVYTNTSTSYNFSNIMNPNYFHLEGCYIMANYFQGGSYDFNQENLANREEHIIRKNFFTPAPSANVGLYQFSSIPANPLGTTIEDNIAYRMCITMGPSTRATEDTSLGIIGALRLYTFKRNAELYSYYHSFTSGSPSLSAKYDIQDNSWEHGDYYYNYGPGIMGINTTFKNNVIWFMYMSTTYGAGGLYLAQTILPTDISENYIDGCAVGIQLGEVVTKSVILRGFHFGATVANTYDIKGGNNALLDVEVASPYQTLNIETTGIRSSVPSSKLMVTRDGNTNNVDYTYTTYGTLKRTGSGLSDTTVHTVGSGKFAIRFEPNNSNVPLTWDFTVPTGDIQNKTMTVAVWCKINSANYYSGTYQLPRLNVNYDNGTITYAQASASTGWQQLFVTFTPTTTYGQITLSLSVKTDQTGSSSYVYWDDMSIILPANVALDLGGLDNWANALPVTPPFALPISPYTVSNAVWEELKTSHVTSGTFGKHLGDLKKPTFLVGGQIIV